MLMLRWDSDDVVEWYRVKCFAFLGKRIGIWQCLNICWFDFGFSWSVMM